ncbi:MAG: WYL domain-containing protein [Gemmatimonadales bacterium]
MSTRRDRGAERRVSKTERWLNLLAYLADRRYPVSRDSILTDVEDYRRGWLTNDDTAKESVRRKFERDTRELRELGIVIQPQRQKVQADHTEGEVEAYLLRPRDLYLPYLDLSTGPARAHEPYSLPRLRLKPEELSTLRRAAERVLALGSTSLSSSAASALRKLSFDLPGVAPGEGEAVLARPVGAAFEQVFAVLREGVERRRAIRCRYYTIGRDEERERVIEPYGLMFSWATWYCIARARDREAVRVFRIDRMRTAELLDDPGAAFTVPADFSVQQYLDRAPWELSDSPPVTVRVRFGFPQSRWIMAEGLGTVVEATDESAGAVLEFGVRTLDAFIRWLLPFGVQAEVLSPDDVRQRLATERARIRDIYR